VLEFKRVDEDYFAEAAIAGDTETVLRKYRSQ